VEANAAPKLAPLAGILTIATALAGSAMYGRVLLDDEVGTMLAVEQGYGEIATTFDEWRTQPAYFLLAKPVTALLGSSELAIRLPALGAALAGLVALARLGARLVSQRVGLLAALLLALQPFHLFYAQMGRGYTLAATLSTLSLLGMLALARGAGPGTGVAYLLARALGVYAHLGALGSGLAELAVAVCVARPRGTAALRRTLAWLAAGAVASALLYLPLLDSLLRFRESWSADVGSFGWGFLPLLLSAWAGGPGWPTLVWLAAVLAGCGLAFRHSPVAGLCLLLWPIGVLAFYVLNGTAHYPWAFARFLFPALPALALAAAIALDALARRMGALAGRIALPAVLVVFLAVTAFQTPAIAFGPRDTDWPALIARLEQAGVRPRDAFALPLRFNAFPHYLARHEGMASQGLAPARLDSLLRNDGTAALAGRRLAFLVDLVAFDETDFRERFELARFGPTTVLVAHRELPRDEATAVAATRAVLEAVIAEREALPRGAIREGWVFWRIHRRHEHAFLPEVDLAIDWALLARLARAEGDASAAARARAQVERYRGEIRRPGEVRASWQLLVPRLLAPAWDGVR
jgi:hypothetical protein